MSDQDAKDRKDLISRLEDEGEWLASENVKLFWRAIRQERRAEKILFAAKAAALRLRAGEHGAAEKILADAINEDGRLAREAIAEQGKPAEEEKPQ